MRDAAGMERLHAKLARALASLERAVPEAGAPETGGPEAGLRILEARARKLAETPPAPRRTRSYLVFRHGSRVLAVDALRIARSARPDATPVRRVKRIHRTDPERPRFVAAHASGKNSTLGPANETLIRGRGPSERRERTGDAGASSPTALRVTSVYRSEGDAWKLVHRHADPITTPR